MQCTNGQSRLLSDAGIPRLRRISKDRLRFKGKGHEVPILPVPLAPIEANAHSQYGDIARMLNMYQLWLDDLYPRAKFADGLSMIEKLGHTKRIQYMRKEWIDEGRPKNNTSDVEPDEDEPTTALVETVEQNTEQMDWLQRDNPNGENDTQEEQMQGKLSRQAEDLRRASEDAEPDDDELDALLAESELQASNVLMTSAMPPKIATSGDDMFAEEMEAMAEMEGW
jgi:replication fork protection complex subunit Csm3/Swi3